MALNLATIRIRENNLLRRTITLTVGTVGWSYSNRGTVDPLAQIWYAHRKLLSPNNIINIYIVTLQREHRGYYLK